MARGARRSWLPRHVSLVLVLVCALEASFWMASALNQPERLDLETQLRDHVANAQTLDADPPSDPPTEPQAHPPPEPETRPPPVKPPPVVARSDDHRLMLELNTQPEQTEPAEPAAPDQQTKPSWLAAAMLLLPIGLLLGLATGSGSGKPPALVWLLGLSGVSALEVDPAAAAVVGWVANPLGLEWGVWLGLLPVHFAAKLLLDKVVEVATVWLLDAKLLGSRDPANPGKRGLQALARIDYTFLAINALIEYGFTFHVARFAWSSGLVSWAASELTVLNSLVALVLIFAVDDFFYAPMHRFMHWRPVYWLVHKHHHKQAFPIRGYFDAGNESPIEQLLGLSCVWITLHIVPLVTGLHAVTLLAFFVLYAATAMLNHSPYDVKLWLGFEYSAGAHEMHHRIPHCNYGQNFMIWDMLMGTYKPYKN